MEGMCERRNEASEKERCARVAGQVCMEKGTSGKMSDWY